MVKNDSSTGYSPRGPSDERSYERPSSPAKRLLKWAVGGVGATAVIATLIGYNTCTTYVKPNEFAVRQVNYNLLGLLGEKGVHTDTIGPGVHRCIPGMETLQTFRRDVEVLTLKMGDSSKKSKDFVEYGSDAKIQTSDGYYIDLDVSFLFHKTDPHLVLTKMGGGATYMNNLKARAEPILKTTFGSMNPEDFFNAELRVEKQNAARTIINTEFEPMGLKVDHVLVRFPHYNPKVQEQIERQIVQEETVFKNNALTEEATAKATLAQTVENGKQQVNILLTQASNAVTRIRAEQEAYDRTKRSDADRLQKEATATSQALINHSYEGAGSESLIGIEYAKFLGNIKTILVPVGGPNDVNPLDLEKMVAPYVGNPTNAAGVR